jgi:hypothetical protein
VGERTVLDLEYAFGDDSDAPGQSLGEVLRAEGRLSYHNLDRYGRDLFTALDQLQAKGVRHRDLKPDNFGVFRRADRSKQLMLFDPGCFCLADAVGGSRGSTGNDAAVSWNRRTAAAERNGSHPVPVERASRCPALHVTYCSVPILRSGSQNALAACCPNYVRIAVTRSTREARSSAAGGVDLRWWTWAGYRANATLAATISDFADEKQSFDDFSIRLRTDLTRAMWRDGTADVSQRLCLPEIDERALAGLKFSAALPHHLAVSTLAGRLADLESATRVLAEPARYTVVNT